jgi:hypothetical protein
MTHPVHPHFTYVVAPQMLLYPMLADGVREDANDVHLSCDVKDDERWYRLRVNGYLSAPVAVTEALADIMGEVFETTPRELATPEDVFLHALGAKTLPESQDLMFRMETVVDGQVRLWRANYAPPKTMYDGAVMVARLLPATAS